MKNSSEYSSFKINKKVKSAGYWSHSLYDKALLLCQNEKIRKCDHLLNKDKDFIENRILNIYGINIIGSPTDILIKSVGFNDLSEIFDLDDSILGDMTEDEFEEMKEEFLSNPDFDEL